MLRFRCDERLVTQIMTKGNPFVHRSLFSNSRVQLKRARTELPCSAKAPAFDHSMTDITASLFGGQRTF